MVISGVLFNHVATVKPQLILRSRDAFVKFGIDEVGVSYPVLTGGTRLLTWYRAMDGFGLIKDTDIWTMFKTSRPESIKPDLVD